MLSADDRRRLEADVSDQQKPRLAISGIRVV